MSLTFLPATKSSRWKPGQSGNPKGAHRDRGLQELARAHTAEAVKTLVVAMRFRGPQQVPAAIALLDRGWGRPTQRVETEADHLHFHLLAAQLTEAVTIEAQPEPERQAPQIEGAVPTE